MNIRTFSLVGDFAAWDSGEIIVQSCGGNAVSSSMGNKHKVMLAAMAAANGEAYTPAQIQKLLFLIDTNLAQRYLGGRQFSFEPYDYGPFDADVYRVADQLATEELVEVNRNDSTGFRTYEATPKGVEAGEQCLEQMKPEARQYMRDASHWVRSMSFSDLISSIYAAYPEMKVNSVFQDEK